MAMTMRELVTKWGFDIDSKPLKEMGANIFLMKESLEAVYDVAKGAFEATFGLTERSAEWAKQTQETADRFHITAQRLQEYQAAARKSHIGTQQFTMSLQHLVDNAFSVAYEGNKQMAAMFQYLGVNVQKNNGEMKNAEELFLDVSEGIKKHTSAAERSAFVTKLMGVRNGALTASMAQGRQYWLDAANNAEKLGVVMGQKGVERLSQFDDQVEDTKAQIEALKNQIALQLVPVFSKLLQQFSDFVNSPQGKEFIYKDLPALIKGLTQLAVAMAKISFKNFKMFQEPISDFFKKKGFADRLKDVGKIAVGVQKIMDPTGLLSGEIKQSSVPAGNSVTNNYHTEVHVNGAGDPHATATAVAQKVDEAHKQKNRTAQRTKNQGGI